MLEPTAPQRARFGPFELDLRSGELTANGRRQTLPEQPLALLKALLERPGELVTRDELRQRLWPSDTFVHFEHGLNAAVKRLRDVLGDSAETPRFIETVPRRGYRFVAPVEGRDNAVPTSSRLQRGEADAVRHTGAAMPEQATAPSGAVSRSRRAAWWAAAAGGAAATITVLAIAYCSTCQPNCHHATRS